MLIYNTTFSETDMEYLRKNKLGLEVFHYAEPDFLDDFDNNHTKITQYMQDMTGVSMHGAYYDLFYASKDPLIREVVKKRFLQNIKAAAFHSIKAIVFHSPYRKFYEGHSKAAIDDFLKRSVEFWLQLERHIPDDMIIYLENIEDDNPEIFIKLIENINSPKIRCCFDIGHAHCNSNVPINTWVDILKHVIGHVHLHDNNGKSDEHLPLGKGNLPLFDTINTILEQVSDDIPFVIECNIIESMKWLRDSGFKNI